MKIVTTERGADLIRGGATLSEVLRAPGPTHSVFDVIAAGIAAFTPGSAAPRVALLGFAGGSLVAPLRAMGCDVRLRCVDIDLDGYEVFQRLCRRWAGAVEVRSAGAVPFLKRQRSPFDLIVDDLSVDSPDGEIKPAVSFDPLPRLIHGSLRRHGVAITNLLDVPGRPFTRLEATLAAPWKHTVSIAVDGHINRILISARNLPGAREINARLNLELDRIGSALHRGIQVRRVGGSNSGARDPA